MIDYTAICSCGNFEQYSSKLNDIKTWAIEHIKNNKDHEIYIDQNKDLEINDSFKSIKIS